MIRMRTASRIVLLAAAVVTATSCGDAHAREPIVGDHRDGYRRSVGKSTVRRHAVLRRPDALHAPAPCTVTAPCATVFADNGQANLHLEPKDIGATGNFVPPGSNNQVTLTRYHVSYRRADGRNTPGVDVPFGFDGAMTATIPGQGNATFTFELVRVQAKQEGPLVQLISGPTVITTIADVTFYGTDLVGNEISVTGSITIEFGNFADAS